MGYDPLRHHRRSIRLRGWDYTRPAAYFITLVTFQRQCLFDDSRFRGVMERCWKSLARRFPRVTLDEFVIMPNHIHGIIIIGADGPPSGDAGRPAGGAPGGTPGRGAGGPAGGAGERAGAPPGAAPVGAQHRKPCPADARRPDRGDSINRTSACGAAPPPARPPAGDTPPAGPPPAGDVPPAPHVVPGSLGAIVRTLKSTSAKHINRIRGTPGAPVWQRNYYEHICRDERALAAIRRYIRANPDRWATDREHPPPTVSKK